MDKNKKIEKWGAFAQLLLDKVPKPQWKEYTSLFDWNASIFMETDPPKRDLNFKSNRQSLDLTYKLITPFTYLVENGHWNVTLDYYKSLNYQSQLETFGDSISALWLRSVLHDDYKMIDRLVNNKLPFTLNHFSSILDVSYRKPELYEYIYETLQVIDDKERWSRYNKQVKTDILFHAFYYNNQEIIDFFRLKNKNFFRINESEAESILHEIGAVIHHNPGIVGLKEAGYTEQHIKIISDFLLSENLLNKNFFSHMQSCKTFQIPILLNHLDKIPEEEYKNFSNLVTGAFENKNVTAQTFEDVYLKVKINNQSLNEIVQMVFNQSKNPLHEIIDTPTIEKEKTNILCKHYLKILCKHAEEYVSPNPELFGKTVKENKKWFGEKAFLYLNTALSTSFEYQDMYTLGWQEQINLLFATKEPDKKTGMVMKML